jgi:hypothetical protein
MATVPTSTKSTIDVLRDAFTQEQIDSLRDEDLLAGYRVSGVLIAVVAFGCLIGTIGVCLAIG